jgi:ParB family chromosome partitioning protein
LRLTVAGIIGRGGSWTVRPETQSANGNKEIAASVEAGAATAVYNEELKAVRTLIGCPGEGYLCAGDFDTDSTKLLTRLMAMSDADLLRVLTLLMAESLAAGGALTEAAGQLMEVDMDKWWRPDDAFFAMLRDKPAIQAMIAEVAGRQAASFSLKDTAKAQIETLRHCLAGTGGQKKAEHWKPRYFRFPMQSYTKRKGIAAIERGNAVRKIIERSR